MKYACALPHTHICLHVQNLFIQIVNTRVFRSTPTHGVGFTVRWHVILSHDVFFFLFSAGIVSLLNSSGKKCSRGRPPPPPPASLPKPPAPTPPPPPPSSDEPDRGHCDDDDDDAMSCAVAVDDLRTDPSVRKCSTSSTSSAGSSSTMTSDEDHDAAAVAVVPEHASPVATGSGRRGHVSAKEPDSEIHTDRDECSSDESNGPDSPTGLKAVGSVYDFRLDEADSPPSSCASNPFVTAGADTVDLTKVARKQLRMIREVVVAVCHLNHTNTIISKILSSKYLRRWENHQIRLQDDCITSNTVSNELYIAASRPLSRTVLSVGSQNGRLSPAG